MEENKKIDMFLEYEMKNAELEDIALMVWYVIEDYYIGNKDADVYTKANYFDRLKCYLLNIHTLLYKTNEEMSDIIKKVYKLKREEKEIIDKTKEEEY